MSMLCSFWDDVVNWVSNWSQTTFIIVVCIFAICGLMGLLSFFKKSINKDKKPKWGVLVVSILCFVILALIFILKKWWFGNNSKNKEIFYVFNTFGWRTNIGCTLDFKFFSNHSNCAFCACGDCSFGCDCHNTFSKWRCKWRWCDNRTARKLLFKKQRWFSWRKIETDHHHLQLCDCCLCDFIFCQPFDLFWKLRGTHERKKKDYWTFR